MTKSIQMSVALALATAILCSSCATPYAWEHTDPHSLNRMPNNSSTEQFIRQNNLRFAPDRDEKHLLVEKTADQKFSCYLGRLTLVPIAIVLDAALICGIALGGAAAADPTLFNSSSSSAYSYKPPTLYAPNGASGYTAYPTLPGTTLRDYSKPGTRVETDSRGNTIAYPTLPGSTLRDYNQPGIKIETDYRGRTIGYPTLPGTTLRDYNQPGVVVEPR